MKFKFTLLFLALGFQYGAGQTGTDPIDVKFDQCIDTSFSSYNMLMCIEAASMEWNDKLDSTYSYLLGKSDSTTKSFLIRSQKSWGRYVDDQFKVWEHFNEESMRKSAYQAAWDYERNYLLIQYTKTRLKELENWSDHLRE